MKRERDPTRANDQSFAVVAVVLVTILSTHWLVTVGRFNSWIGKLVDHRVKVLLDHGRLRHDQLRLCGLTERRFLLSSVGTASPASASCDTCLLYETKGELTIVREVGEETFDPKPIQIGL